MVGHITGFFGSLHFALFETGTLCNALQQELPTEQILPLIHRASANDLKNGKSPLYLAIEKSRLDLIEALLREGAEPFFHFGQTGDTAAHLALRRKNPELFKTLLGAHTSIEQLNSQNLHDGTSLLVLAVELGCEASVRLLLEAGANPNFACGEKKWTALHAATAKGDLALIQLLLQHTGSVDRLTSQGESPLYLACAAGSIDTAKALLEARANPNQLNGPDRTHSPLQVAITNGHAKLITLLAKHGTNIQAPLKPHGIKPLYLASERGDEPVVSSLLQAGALIDEVWQNQTALHVATFKGHSVVVKRLLTHGINRKLAIYRQHPPLELALLKNQVEAARCLLEGGFSANEPVEATGESPIHTAAKMGKVAFIALYIESHAEINQRSKVNVTPLYLACEAGHLETAKTLLRAGASVHERCGPQHKTALQIASERERLDIITLLLDSGAKFDTVTQGFSHRVTLTYFQYHRRRLNASLERIQNERSIETLRSVLETIQNHFSLDKQLCVQSEEQIFKKVMLGMLELQGELLSFAHRSLEEEGAETFPQEAFSKTLAIVTQQQMIFQMLSKTIFFPLVLEKTSLCTSIILSEKFSRALKAQQKFFKETQERHLKEQQAIEQLIVSINESIHAITEIVKIYPYLFHEAICDSYTLPLRKHSLANQLARQDCNSILVKLRCAANPQQEFDEEDAFGLLDRLFVSQEVTRVANKQSQQACLERLVECETKHIWNCGLREGKDLRLIGIDDDLLILLQNIRLEAPDNWNEGRKILERMQQRLTAIPDSRGAKELLSSIDPILHLSAVSDKRQLEQVKRELSQFHSHYCPVILRAFVQKNRETLPVLLAKHGCESLTDLQKIEPLKTI